MFLIFSSRDRICGLFRPTRSEQDDNNRPHFPARCLSSVIEPTTGAIHRYTGSSKPMDSRTSQIWWPDVLTHNQQKAWHANNRWHANILLGCLFNFTLQSVTYDVWRPKFTASLKYKMLFVIDWLLFGTVL